ncbi:MAG: DUF1800 domain-containing protein [Acidimicrobiia bacterium]|nr:DUF1800 domain-containing protein [Acidimicrobiia bacterium]NNF64352.1 DUF1800 domain-containing protein [Acidimicrobiia bacterium]
MSISTRETTSHVFRRLGLGAFPDRVVASDGLEDAIAAALDLASPAAVPPELEPPSSMESARDREANRPILEFWFEQMLTSDRLIEERLIWFWHDHFATSILKVKVPYLMWLQHLTFRRLATGNFADLLHAIAIDPAMLMYLDGTQNRRGAVNENFGREVMELFTVGHGNFHEDDVIAASRAFTGWVVNIPDRRWTLPDRAPWSAVFVPFRHDNGPKTFHGTTGPIDTAGAIDVLLDHPATARSIASKLYTELVGAPPDEATRDSLAVDFRRDYEVMPLVESIVGHPDFTSATAIRSKVATPLERALGAVRGFGDKTDLAVRAAARYLDVVDYFPFRPPNVAGYPEGPRLLGPHQLIHGFDLAHVPRAPVPDLTPEALLNRLGVFDISESTFAVLENASTPETRFALAINSPEVMLT